MKTNKQWKRVPFDIELVKKIQSGEVEGRIITESGHSVRIICFDKKTYPGIDSYPIVALVDFIQFEHVYIFLNSGICVYKDMKLCIELPEETPKHEFKIGDKVKIIYGMYAGRYGTISKMVYHKLTNNARVDISTVMQPYLPCEYLEKCEEPSNDKKHEFKPFDKVLVRNNEHEAWQARLYDVYFFELELHGTQDNKEYRQCIPYEGNEHLVGTTNPE